MEAPSNGGSCGDSDLLTCGDCSEEFLLSDIVRFISHKATCSGGKRSKKERRRDDHRRSTSDDEVDSEDDIDRSALTAAMRLNSDCSNEAAVNVLQSDAGNRTKPPLQQLSSPVSTNLCCDSSLPDDEVPVTGATSRSETTALRIRTKQQAISATEVSGSTAVGMLFIYEYG